MTSSSAMDLIVFLSVLTFLSFSQAADTASASNSGAISLTEAVSEARRQSPKLQRSGSMAEEASWKKVEAYSGFLPSVNLSTTYLTSYRYALTDITLGGSPVSVPQVVPTSNVAITATLPLFDGFASTNRLLSANSFSEAAKQDYSWTQFQVDREVTLQFYKTLGALILKDVANQNVKTLQDHLNDVSLFKKAGLSTHYDVLRVEVQVSEAQTELLNSVDNIEINRNRLSELFGKDTDVRELSGSLPVLSPELIKSIDVNNLKGRTDLQALENRTEGFRQNESSMERYWVPRINAFGQYQYYNNLNDRFDDRERYREAYQIGVQLNWNLFDGMISIAKSKQSIEQKYQAEKALRIAQIRAQQDASFWKRKYIYFCSVYQSRTADVKKSTESLRLAKEGRRVGARTNTDLLDTETELFRAQAAVINAQVGAVEALINLELATGQKLYTFN
ncbi:MAG: TolC family protein [Bdellovibrio sp.]|nr:TolC family protein [Bdellovibrio sp.]